MNKACKVCEHHIYIKKTNEFDMGMHWCKKYNDAIRDIEICEFLKFNSNKISNYAQYIDKAVIVMIIEKLIAKYKEISVGVDKKGNDWVDSVSMLNAKIDTLQSLLSIIDSLEVKEVDLEKEIDRYCEPIQAWQIQEAPYTNIEKCARHFYELGLKTQKGE